MEFAVICLVAVVLGFRGWRAGRRAYVAVAALTTGAALYLYHF
jgi:uncharacterized membrane protein YtjA (UPF0391 family)